MLQTVVLEADRTLVITLTELPGWELTRELRIELRDTTRVVFEGQIEPDWFLSSVHAFDLAGAPMPLDPVTGVPISKFQVLDTNGASIEVTGGLMTIVH